VYDDDDDLAGFMSLLHEISDDSLMGMITGAPAQVDPSVNPGVNHLWLALEARLQIKAGCLGAVRGGMLSDHPPAAREEAAQKLIQNHEAVLLDATDGSPVSQHDLPRVSEFFRPCVDQALREVVRKLLGDAGGGLLVEQLPPDHPSFSSQRNVWTEVSAYLTQRVQTEVHVSGRRPDMSVAAAAALRAALKDIISS